MGGGRASAFEVKRDSANRTSRRHGKVNGGNFDFQNVITNVASTDKASLLFCNSLCTKSSKGAVQGKSAIFESILNGT